MYECAPFVGRTRRRARARAMDDDDDDDGRGRGRVIDDAFDDGISSVFWAPRSRHGQCDGDDDDDGAMMMLCGATSWSGDVRVYGARARLAGQHARLHAFKTTSPQLCGTFVDRTHVVSGGADGAVRAFDARTGAERVVGAHREAVSCVEYDGENAPNMVFSASYDRTLKAWDLRAPGGGDGGRCAASTSLPGKAFTSDVANGTLFLGASDRQILAYKTSDIISGGRPVINRQSSMRFQTRCVRGNPRGDSLVVASVEGRVAVEYVADDRNERERYAFKCHRKTDPATGEVIYPVHAVSFHPLGTFATGGGDGYVNIWDGAAKKRLFQCPRYPTSVAALAFSPCGTMLAVASSYAQEEREKNTPQDRLYIRVIGDDAEVTPKAVAAAAAAK